MIVDPHHHLWEHAQNPYMMGELRADTGRVPGVTNTVFVECASAYRTDGPEAFRPVGETEFVVAADPDRFISGIIGFADLTAPEIDDVLAAHVAAGDGRFRGIRHASAFDASPDVRVTHTKPPPELLGMADFRRGIVALGAAGLSFEAWMYHPQLPSSRHWPATSRTCRSCSTTSAGRSGSGRTPVAATRSSPTGGSPWPRSPRVRT